MDPLSITISCITLITSIVKVSLQINGFIREVRDARGDLDAVSRELLSLKTVLEMLSEDADKGKGFPESLLKQISGILTNCGGVVEQIQVSLEKYGGGGIRRGVKWSISGREDMNKLRLTLEAHKTALDIALDMITLTIAREIKMDTERLRDDTTQIRTDTAGIKDDTAKLRNDATEIKDNTSNLRNDTTGIKDDTAQILAEIARLQARLSQDHLVGSGSGFALQRYLDSFTEYAETTYAHSENGSDSGIIISDDSVSIEKALSIPRVLQPAMTANEPTSRSPTDKVESNPLEIYHPIDKPATTPLKQVVEDAEDVQDSAESGDHNRLGASDVVEEQEQRNPPSITFTQYSHPRNSSPSFSFPSFTRMLPPGETTLNIGRNYPLPKGQSGHQKNLLSAEPIAFESTCLYTPQCQLYCDVDLSQWYIKKCRFACNTYLNGVSLSAPLVESHWYILSDGDIVKLRIGQIDANEDDNARRPVVFQVGLNKFKTLPI